jgi:hypothetical protein
MKNYTYILTNLENEKISEDEFNNLFDNILLKFHYPACQSNETLSPSEKKRICTNEYEFIQEKIIPFNAKVVKIPRLIYDLYCICFSIQNESIKNGATNGFRITADEGTETYKQLNDEYINWYHSKLKPIAYSLNNYILEKLININSINSNQYVEMLQSIHLQMKTEIDDQASLLIEYFKRNKTQILRELSPMLKTLQDDLKKGNKIRDKIDYDYETYSDDKKSLDVFRCVVYFFRHTRRRESVSTIFDNSKESNLIIEESINYGFQFINIPVANYIENYNYQLLKTVLESDLSETSVGKEQFFLYRGSKNSHSDTPIDKTNTNRGYSLSYNTSILSGFFHDSGACTYTFMNENIEKDSSHYLFF